MQSEVLAKKSNNFTQAKVKITSHEVIVTQPVRGNDKKRWAVSVSDELAKHIKDTAGSARGGSSTKTRYQRVSVYAKRQALVRCIGFELPSAW